MADETAFYIVSSLEFKAAERSDYGTAQGVTLGTDGDAYLDGRLITIDSP